MRHFSESPLLTDLYELTMLQAYFLRGMDQPASFEFFVRRLPGQRNFLISAGLAQVAAYLAALRFDDADLDWMRASGRFAPLFVDSLRDFRFTGDVDAMPEGSIFFPDEPLLRVSAPLGQAQFIESRVINLLHYQTLVASKAARVVLAAQGRPVVDFGLRRAHGAEAGLLAARATYLAGFAGSANVAAGAAFGIPLYGTMAHSFVLAHENEAEAFASYAHAYPNSTTLLIDTFDSEAAARQVAPLARRLREQEGIAIKAVRIDSGDLGATACAVRAILDEGGSPGIEILASGDLDESRIATLLGQGAPIDGFGVGTRVACSADVPYLDCAYKLVAYAGRPCRKRSAGKQNWPGAKQVFRELDAQGRFAGDTLTLSEMPLSGQPLLQPVLRGGAVVAPLPSLEASRAHASAQLGALPQALRSLQPAPPYVLRIAPGVQELARQADVQGPLRRPGADGGGRID